MPRDVPRLLYLYYITLYCSVWCIKTCGGYYHYIIPYYIVGVWCLMTCRGSYIYIISFCIATSDASRHAAAIIIISYHIILWRLMHQDVPCLLSLYHIILYCRRLIYQDVPRLLSLYYIILYFGVRCIKTCHAYYHYIISYYIAGAWCIKTYRGSYIYII